ncbi:MULTISPECIES: hypothetical protein [unclassified Variovorax]|nr:MULTISPECIES: hypothetical protein [unclassified Variovorax]
MRTNFIQLQGAIEAARSRQLTPGRFVVLKDTDELALVLRYNDAELSLYPGHDYPVVVRTGLGEQECALEDLHMSPLDQVVAVLEDDRQVWVRAVQTGAGWVLHDAQGRALALDQLVELHADSF